MAKTGRNPFTTYDTAPYGTGKRRLSPPSSLGEREKAHFLALVSRCPATQFEPSDLPLICRWCELCAMAEEASERLAIEDLVVGGKINVWFTVHQAVTKSLSGLALRLKVSPQARSPKAPKVKAAQMSVYDMMELSEPDDEAQHNN
jgi:predicted metal-binding membrane protein